MDIRHRALHALQEPDPVTKCAAAQSIWAACQQGAPLDTQVQWTPTASLPGRPEHPVLVEPAQVARRSPFTPEGRAALLHAVAHIEFNAINLALDAVWRFPGMPNDYYADWLRVAAEEAHHFALLTAHLLTLGYDYGDFVAHDGLWSMAQKTAGDITARMALVPRTLEARGLDATPPMQARLAKAGDQKAVEILDVILRDEIGHVAIGNHWYGWLCDRHGLDPISHYARLAQDYAAPKLLAPLNLEARRRAGFSAQELDAMTRE